MKLFISDELSTSQEQAVIKLMENKERDKKVIKKWRQIPLLNSTSKVRVTMLKKI